MKKLIYSSIAVIFLVFAVRSYAAFEVKRIDVDFANKNAELDMVGGDYNAVNQTMANGEIYTVNSFTPNNEATTILVPDPAFSNIFGGLVQQQAVNMDAVVNAVVGIAHAGISGADTTTTDTGVNWY